ncbi:hypothetical protein OHB37_10805 [Streptomyces albidoflavus]|uniref:hypothetical protein n=1 Tax=Streptomyces TaxID=1883 RepID=UPI00081EC304|nr:MULTISPECIES: hypothetical protein [unclassified Streptomyces]NEC94539.1 hypothetical protein [Streptomyces albidoflavus]SCD56799.1 hypothetical protein GA0115236_11183 [Streptomyces sp. IgraMP-1]MBT2877853.1 hypothetical protein [Streptomyces sp. McG6]MBT2884124.1 hypothetical protein [Streptomyces sp. McG5]MBT2890709.1 hypothetical protein [Streptomyces sp. McG2]
MLPFSAGASTPRTCISFPRTAINGGKGHQAVSEVVHDEQIEALADLGGEFPHPDHDMMYPSPRDYTFSLNS